MDVNILPGFCQQISDFNKRALLIAKSWPSLSDLCGLMRQEGLQEGPVEPVHGGFRTRRNDESRFYLSTCDRHDRLWRRRGECYAACNIIQHDWFGGGSVMVWGGISLEGRTDLYRLDNGTLTAIMYQDEILGPVVRPYAGAFADDTTVVGLISKNDESAYREEVQRLTDWCRTNNLSLNVDKTKEMVVDFRRTRRDHSPLHIDGSTVEIVKTTKLLGVHLAEDLTWSLNTSTITKKAQQRLYFLRRLRKAHLPPPILTTFYRGTIESILSSCITAWFGNCTASHCKSLQRVVRTTEKIIGVSLPTITDIYTTRCIQKATSIVVRSSTFVLVKMTNESTGGGSMVSTKMNCLLSHVTPSEGRHLQNL
ncbi:hypothetical protein NFI96_003852 [Prochilodus magdalenae]|nr:hypothetical protein NFI96_003852 [Prochilodus magdalenae]